MKGEELEYFEDQIDYVPPAQIKVELAQARYDIALLKGEITRLEKEIQLLRNVQRATDPRTIPDWKMVAFDGPNDTQSSTVWYKGQIVQAVNPPLYTNVATRFAPHDTRNPKNIKKHKKYGR